MTAPIRRSLHRHTLVLGGDRELVMFSGLRAFLTALGGFSLFSAVCGLAFWLVALFWLRKWAKEDPMMRHVWLRHIRQQDYYPAKTTVFMGLASPAPGRPRRWPDVELKLFRKPVKGLPELIPHIRLVAPGVVVNKDGSLMAAWEFRGSDTASSTIEELDFVTAQANQALLGLGNGWMIHVDAVRRPATNYPAPGLSHFPDSVSQMIDDERRAFFSRETCFETNTVLALAYKTPVSLTVNMLGDKRTDERVLSEFLADLDNFESILSGVLSMERLDKYEELDEFGQSHTYSALLTHIQQCLTGDFHPMMVPQPCGMFLDGILASQDLVGGLAPMLGEKHLSVVAIDGFPQESYPAILDMLSGQPLSYRFNTRFIPLDQLDAVKGLPQNKCFIYFGAGCIL